MTNPLAQKIQDLLDKRNLTVYALEKKAGIKTHTVRNILNGASLKPSGDLLKTIAFHLEVSLDELLDHHLPCADNVPDIDLDLITRATELVTTTLKENNLSPRDFDSVFKLVLKVYDFIKVDEDDDARYNHKFVKWLIKSSFK